jgi:hypothetical protein
MRLDMQAIPHTSTELPQMLKIPAQSSASANNSNIGENG